MAAKGLGQRAMKGELAHFLPGDFYYVVDKTSRSPERLILVGGQALEVWGVVLDVAPPSSVTDGEHYFHALTVDTDWLGQKDDAQWLAKLLGLDSTELNIPEVGNPTPSTAILYLERNGRVMLMDFLANITGVENADLMKYAADVDMPMPNGTTASLRVLDPVHCLLSRMANLKAYAKKREGNGLLQAKWAIDIVRAYLRYMVAVGASEAIMRKQCHRVAELAEHASKSAEYCWLHYRIDPLEAVSEDVVDACGTRFAGIDWPLTVQRIRRKQEKWLNKKATTMVVGSS